MAFSAVSLTPGEGTRSAFTKVVNIVNGKVAPERIMRGGAHARGRTPVWCAPTPRLVCANSAFGVRQLRLTFWVSAGVQGVMDCADVQALNTIGVSVLGCCVDGFPTVATTHTLFK